MRGIGFPVGVVFTGVVLPMPLLLLVVVVVVDPVMVVSGEAIKIEVLSVAGVS